MREKKVFSARVEGEKWRKMSKAQVTSNAAAADKVDWDVRKPVSRVF